MQNATTNAKLCIFCIFVLFYAGFLTKSELCTPSEDQDIDSPSCRHGNYFYLATKFRNIMNDLQHSLNIQCSTVADKMKFIVLPHGNQIHLATITKIHFLGQEVFVY